jgi:hypothetical protein
MLACYQRKACRNSSRTPEFAQDGKGTDNSMWCSPHIRNMSSSQNWQDLKRFSPMETIRYHMMTWVPHPLYNVLDRPNWPKEVKSTLYKNYHPHPQYQLKQKLHTASTCTDKPMPDGPKHFITCHTNNARGHRRTARIEPAQFRTKKKDCSEWNRDREPPVRGEKARGHGPSSPRASSLAGHRPLILRPRSSGTKAAGPARSRSLRLPPRGHDEQCVARNPRTKRTGRSTRGGEPERPRQIGGGRRGGGCGRGGPSAPCRPASGGGRDRGWPVGPACQRGGNGAGRRRGGWGGARVERYKGRRRGRVAGGDWQSGWEPVRALGPRVRWRTRERNGRRRGGGGAR